MTSTVSTLLNPTTPTRATPLDSIESTKFSAVSSRLHPPDSCADSHLLSYSSYVRYRSFAELGAPFAIAEANLPTIYSYSKAFGASPVVFGAVPSLHAATSICCGLFVTRYSSGYKGLAFMWAYCFWMVSGALPSTRTTGADLSLTSLSSGRLNTSTTTSQLTSSSAPSTPASPSSSLSAPRCASSIASTSPRVSRTDGSD